MSQSNQILCFWRNYNKKYKNFLLRVNTTKEGNEIKMVTFDNGKMQQVLKEYKIDELSRDYPLDFIGKGYAKKQDPFLSL